MVFDGAPLDIVHWAPGAKEKAVTLGANSSPASAAIREQLKLPRGRRAGGRIRRKRRARRRRRASSATTSSRSSTTSSSSTRKQMAALTKAKKAVTR
jgi:hypothetical protein